LADRIRGVEDSMLKPAISRGRKSGYRAMEQLVVRFWMMVEKGEGKLNRGLKRTRA